jgi:hypothetical protein
MKYIIHKTMGPILFSSHINHDLMAKWLGGKDAVLSAGAYFCIPEHGKSGMGSSTLGLPENTEDAQVIERHLKP